MSSSDNQLAEQRKVSEDFDRYVESYGTQIDDAIAFSGLKADFFVKAKCTYLERLAKRHFGRIDSLKVLDLGCGVGNYHAHMKGMFGGLCAIDVSERSIEYARKQGNDVEYSVYPGGRLPYESEVFDLVFASCVMHHVPVSDWPGFVSEMKRVLKPGGLAVIFEHNPRNPVTRRIVSTCPIDADAVLLPTPQIKSLFANAGFGEITVRSIFSIPPLAQPLFELDEMLGVLGVGAQYYLTARKPS